MKFEYNDYGCDGCNWESDVDDEQASAFLRLMEAGGAILSTGLACPIDLEGKSPREIMETLTAEGDGTNAEFNLSIGYAMLTRCESGWTISASDEDVAKYLEELIDDEEEEE